MKLKENDKVLLVASSNQLQKNNKEILNEIISILKGFKLNVILAQGLIKEDCKFSSGLFRGKELIKGFEDPNIKYIFDISGGDLCNEILPYLDFDLIKNSNAIYFGYSDLSVLLNSIYSNSNKKSYYYNIKTILSNEGLENFYNTFINENTSESLFSSWKYKWLIKKEFSGIVVGGNIRCTLKLAGTKYMPEFKDKILFLESNGGDITKVRSFIAQYKMLGIFNDIKGIILGQFTEIDLKNEWEELENIFISICSSKNIPLIKTNDIGHSINSKGICIGGFLKIS